MGFDRIIVGAGIAACVLADRSTAPGRHRVLLVEAGDKPTNPFVKIPAGAARLFGSKVDSDKDLRAWLDTCIQTVCQPTGTCRMGTDDRTVVTPCLPVRGAGGLWVAVASVMPAVPRGQPNAVVAMIADHAAGRGGGGRMAPIRTRRCGPDPWRPAYRGSNRNRR